MNNLITIMTATVNNELSVAISVLEENGVMSYIKDENLSQILPYQGVELQVAKEDVERALDILVEGGFITEDEREEIL